MLYSTFFFTPLSYHNAPVTSKQAHNDLVATTTWSMKRPRPSIPCWEITSVKTFPDCLTGIDTTSTQSHTSKHLKMPSSEEYSLAPHQISQPSVQLNQQQSRTTNIKSNNSAKRSILLPFTPCPPESEITPHLPNAPIPHPTLPSLYPTSPL